MAEKSVKKNIVIAATEFFSHFGFHKTTMDDIAKKIHKAKGALYYYFGSKEELYKEVVSQELEKIIDELLIVLQHKGNPIETIERYIKARLKLFNSAKNYHETLKADFTDSYKFVDSAREKFNNFEHQQIRAIIQEGVENGVVELSDIDATTKLILMLLRTMEVPLYLQDKYEEYQQSIDELITLISNGLKQAK